MIAFKKSYVPEVEAKLELRYNALVKSAIKRGEFDDLYDAEFVLSGGTDTHWRDVIIFVASNFPDDFIEDLSDGVIDDGLDSRTLQFLSVQMNDRVTSS